VARELDRQPKGRHCHGCQVRASFGVVFPLPRVVNPKDSSSHDSGFLDAICTDIIHYENKRLVYYKGNLEK
jgi:hypothetical protein